jgi:hypothetical protein
MFTREIQPEDIPPTLYEIDEARHRQVRAVDAKRERIRLRLANQANDIREPRPGDKLYVQLENAITRRSRGGVRFERRTRYVVEVVDVAPEGTSAAELKAAQVAAGGRYLVMTQAELKAAQAAGRHLVDVEGAELIFEDKAFLKFTVPMSDDDMEALKGSHEALERTTREQALELETLRAELRRARQNAPESAEGKPMRLRAQQEAMSKVAGAASSPPAKPAVTTEDDHAEFGAKPDRG